MTAAALQPLFAYFGGKTRLARQIAALLPPHSHYVEICAGSLAVLLAKPPTRLETASDIDGDLMCFWTVLRERPDALARVCAMTPHARAEHAASYVLPPDLDDLERARRVWVQLTQGRMGVRTRTGWRTYIDPASTTTAMPGYLDAYVGRMAAAAQRLHNVSLESRPALKLIEDYGRCPEVLIYADLPYLGSTRTSRRYMHELRGVDDHRELADALRRCQASVVLSAYRCPLYDELYADWTASRSPPQPARAAPARTGSRSCGPTGPSVTHSCSPSTEPPNRISPGRIVAMYRNTATENEKRW